MATFGDLLIQQGVPIPTVARLMRHSDVGIEIERRVIERLSHPLSVLFQVIFHIELHRTAEPAMKDGVALSNS
jgi:hypothetical protein